MRLGVVVGPAVSVHRDESRAARRTERRAGRRLPGSDLGRDPLAHRQPPAASFSLVRQPRGGEKEIKFKVNLKDKGGLHSVICMQRGGGGIDAFVGGVELTGYRGGSCRQGVSANGGPGGVPAEVHHRCGTCGQRTRA